MIGSNTKESRTAIAMGMRTEEATFNTANAIIIAMNSMRKKLAEANLFGGFIQSPIAINQRFITSNPQYGTRASGIVIEPSSFW